MGLTDTDKTHFTDTTGFVSFVSSEVPSVFLGFVSVSSGGCAFLRLITSN